MTLLLLTTATVGTSTQLLPSPSPSDRPLHGPYAHSLTLRQLSEEGHVCEDTCAGASASLVFNNVCDDGGAGSEYALCDLGTDCTDCGLRVSSPPFIFNGAAFANTMVMSALVSLSGVDQTSGVLMAWSGTELRGIQQTTSTPPFGAYVGKSVFQITLYADFGGETMHFELYTGVEFVSLVETVTFEVNGSVGNALAPFLLTNEIANSSALHAFPSSSPPRMFLSSSYSESIANFTEPGSTCTADIENRGEARGMTSILLVANLTSRMVIRLVSGNFSNVEGKQRTSRTDDGFIVQSVTKMVVASALLATGVSKHSTVEEVCGNAMCAMPKEFVDKFLYSRNVTLAELMAHTSGFPVSYTHLTLPTICSV